jgi:hypothetical protein
VSRGCMGSSALPAAPASMGFNTAGVRSQDSVPAWQGQPRGRCFVPRTGASADTEEKEREADDPAIGSAEAMPDAAAAGIAAAVQAVAAVDHDQGLGGSVAEDEIASAARNVIQTAVAYRVEAAELGVVQFSDERGQEKSVMVQTLRRNKHYRGRRVWRDGDGLVRVATDVGDRIVLPAIYWALAFKEALDSIWVGPCGVPRIPRGCSACTGGHTCGTQCIVVCLRVRLAVPGRQSQKRWFRN